MKEKKFKLSTQINLIFTGITVLTSILFLLIYQQTLTNYIQSQAYENHIFYHQQTSNDLKNKYKNNLSYNLVESSHYWYAFVKINNKGEVIEWVERGYRGTSLDTVVRSIANEFVVLGNINKKLDKQINGYDALGTLINEDNYIIITFSDGSYARTLAKANNNIITIGFISIIVLGNVIILLWSSITVERIKKLENDVSNLCETGYEIEVESVGNDEISELAKTIEQMRVEILESEKVKQEILQNISHDIKTPISVIQSHTEAIKDGIIEGADAADIILRQTQVLNKKAKQLLEWNKLEYLKSEKDFYEVKIKDVILNVVNNHKYHNNIKFELELDDSIYIGISENFYTAFSNIVDNGLRYAESVIRITLKNKKLTFYNDGEHISEEFIDHVFKPYEKGHKGQFGLGMTIVQKTLNSFNLKLTIKNEIKGVSFIIEPRE